MVCTWRARLILILRWSETIQRNHIKKPTIRLSTENRTTLRKYFLLTLGYLPKVAYEYKQRFSLTVFARVTSPPPNTFARSFAFALFAYGLNVLEGEGTQTIHAVSIAWCCLRFLSLFQGTLRLFEMMSTLKWWVSSNADTRKQLVVRALWKAKL